MIPRVNWENSTERLRDLLDFTGANARCAHPDAAAGAIDEGADVLEIEIPAALGNVVRVADPIAELRATTADFANLCHKLIILAD